MNKIVCYTCITGGYDTLKEVPQMDGIDFICFTDDMNIDKKNWEIRKIPDELDCLSNVKKQRIVKICPHRYLKEYDISIWVDANLQILGNLNDIIKSLDFSKTSMFVKKHPGRNCLYDEAEACKMYKFDSNQTIDSQIEKYKNEKFPANYGLVETNILFRKHNDVNLQLLNNMWAIELLANSYRDQLSFTYTCWKNKYQLHNLDDQIITKYFKRVKHEKYLFKKEYLKDKNENFPIVTVIITTHNRTNVACESIYYLNKNLKYSGKIKWCISDDRSNSEHLNILTKKFLELKIQDFKILKTNQYKFGLAVSLNNALAYAWKYSDIVLTTEDDWILEKELNIDNYVKILQTDQTISAIRLAANNNSCSYTNSKYQDLYQLYANNPNMKSIFNLQVALRHKRHFDIIGMYNDELINTDEIEFDMSNRYNYYSSDGTKKLYVLIPKSIKYGTLDDSSLYFIHVGKSTVGHDNYIIPDRYKYLYEEKQKILKILIFSAGNNNLKFQYQKTNLNKELYCKKYQYEYKFIELTNDYETSFYARIDLIKNFIMSNKYDWIMWMDCDTWFNNFKIPLHELIQKYANNKTSLIIARDHYVINEPKTWHDCYINSGILLFKSCHDSLEIINMWKNPSIDAKKWLDTCHFTAMADQAQLAILLLWDKFTKEHTIILTPDIINNFARLGFNQFTYILHVPGNKSIQSREWYIDHFNELYEKSYKYWK